MAKNVQPYLKLIGLGHLEQQMGGMFVIASILADQLEQTVDQTKDEFLDDWTDTYIFDKPNRDPKVHYQQFYFGVQQLKPYQNKTIQELVNNLLQILPQP